MTTIIDHATQQIIEDDWRTGAQRFRDWYLPHVQEIDRRWLDNHPGAQRPPSEDFLMTGRAP